MNTVTITREFAERIIYDLEEALCNPGGDHTESNIEESIASLRAAIEQMEKAEPVAWLHSLRSDSDVITDKVKHVWNGVAVGREAQYTIPLYTHPAAAPEAPK